MQRARLRRRRRLAATAGVTLAAVGLAGGLLGTLPADRGDRLVPAAPPAEVVRDGTRVTGTSRLVRTTSGAVQFCAGAEARPAIGYPPGGEPAPEPCLPSTRVDLRGAYDLQALRDRRDKDGAVEGWATVTGVYRDRTLTVERQRPAPPERRDTGWYTRSDPPCRPPAGGWPQDPALLVPVGAPNEGDVNLSAEQPVLERYRAAHPARIVQVRLLRPFPDSAVLGVTAPDQAARDAVEADLRPTYGQRLCAVVSRYSRRQVAAAERALRPYTPQAAALGIVQASAAVDDRLQPEVVAEVVAVTPQLQAIADRFPAGLVRFEPTLTPVE